MSGAPADHRGTVQVVTTAAAGLAVTYPVLGVVALAFLLPLGQTSSAGPGTLDSLVEHGTGWWSTARWLFLVSALLGLGLWWPAPAPSPWPPSSSAGSRCWCTARSEPQAGTVVVDGG